MSAPTWQPTRTYSKNLWVMFSSTDLFFASPLGLVTSPEEARLAMIQSNGIFKGMQLRKYSRYQPGKAARVLPLKLALEEINNKNGLGE